MKNLLLPFSILLLSASCQRNHVIEVTNDSDNPAVDIIIETPLANIERLMGNGPFVISDGSREIPYQITHDSLVIFPATVDARWVVSYTLKAGEPSLPDTIACGAFYPQRKDDMAWENDKCAYRAYGKALQASGERAYGYDVWTKSVEHPVVRQRYINAFNKTANFHENHGDGMDVYTVGPTLGAGTAALIDAGENIVYPWCFDRYEILDNGPLRFSVSLSYPPAIIDNDSSVVEKRIITLDRGQFLNRTRVTYTGLSAPSTIAPGIVVHSHNPEGYLLNQHKSFMAYADLTDNPEADNGVIYIGVVTPEADTLVVSPLPSPQADAVAHLLAKKTYNPGDTFVYYWGAGWSEGFMPDWDSWLSYLEEFSYRLNNPLTVTIK